MRDLSSDVYYLRLKAVNDISKKLRTEVRELVEQSVISILGSFYLVTQDHIRVGQSPDNTSMALHSTQSCSAEAWFIARINFRFSSIAIGHRRKFLHLVQKWTSRYINPHLLCSMHHEERRFIKKSSLLTAVAL